MQSGKARTYLIGITWFILSLIISNLNDVASKYLGYRLHAAEVSFFRFLFGTLSLLPFMVYYGREAFRTTRSVMHIMRGVILFFAIGIWVYGLGIVPITTATLMTFTIPLIVLIMAPIFLGEKVSKPLWFATVIGFIGVAFVFNPGSDGFNPMALVMLVSALLFATLDIINKKYVAQESMLSMLFYSAVVTTILGAYPAYLYWQEPTGFELAMLFALGAGSNLILFCLLKAFAAAQASALAPYRYLELVLSAGFGYLIFNEVPEFAMYVGAALIIPSTLYIAYTEIQKDKGQQADSQEELAEATR